MMDFPVETIIGLSLFMLLLVFMNIYVHLTKNYNYWRDRGVVCKRPVFPFGSTRNLVLAQTYIGKGYDEMYKEFPNERFFGIIDVKNPVLIIKDPDLVKAIMVKDFNHFAVRYSGANPKEYILKHVINMNGEEWKEMRTLLIPAFSSVKMKSAFVLMEKCTDCLISQLFKITCTNDLVEITDLLARFTMDVIASCAFGLETKCVSDPECRFFHAVGGMLKTTKSRFFRRFLVNFFPDLVRLFPVKLIPPEVTNVLTSAVQDVVMQRENFSVKRNDFLDVLIQTRRKKLTNNDIRKNYTHNKSGLDKEHQGLTIEQMTAQAFVFFIAGYTTDTSIMSFCLLELARHQVLQKKVYDDIIKAVESHDGLINYETLQDMSYLDQVVNETLRLYGSGQILTRICTQSYKIPESDVVLEPGIRVVIPIYSFHHDPKYFPEPYRFDPDRFHPSVVKDRHPFLFLPFGEGPRNCIARSFGLLHIKIGLAYLIKNFQIDLKQEQRFPIEIDKRCFVVTPANPVFLRFSPRGKTN